MSQDYQDQDLPAEEEPAMLGTSGEETEPGVYYGETGGNPVSKGTLIMFGILVAAGIGTYFMYVRSGTQSASAAADVKTQQVIKQFINDRDRSFAQMQKMLKDTDAVVKQFLAYPSVTQVPLSDLHTNPFRINPAAPEDNTVQAKRDEEKEKKRREEERLAVLRAVQALQLQSVVHSDAHKACMINNTLYSEGQQVDAFTIERIATNSIIVRNGSYRFELRMQR